MKKVLLALAVLGTVFLTACEKDNSLEPANETLLKSDKGLMCRGCGDWDIAAPEESSAFETETFVSRTDSVATPVGKGKGNGRGDGKGKGN